MSRLDLGNGNKPLSSTNKRSKKKPQKQNGDTMGLDVYSYLILGIRVKYNYFLKNVGLVKKCPKKHINEMVSKFCGQCAKKLTEYRLKEPTEHFKNYIDKNYEHPEIIQSTDVWNELMSKKQGVGIFKIGSVMIKDNIYPLALGIKIGSNELTDEPISIQLSNLKEESDKVLAMATQFGIDNTQLEIFTCSYLSY